MKKQIMLLLFVLLVFCSLTCVSAEDNSTIDDNASSPEFASVTGNTFNDINSEITNAKAGSTIYLNNKTYTGNSQIVISKNIVIDGASSTNPNTVSVLDAQNLTRIFKINGPYTVTLKI
jgi:Stress-inducible humoral factor Turandot.